MTPKEKAIYLTDKYIDKMPKLKYQTGLLIMSYAKQCALISVDEILSEYWSHDTKRRDWWKEVKQEIENL